jgi:hypothetical protein
MFSPAIPLIPDMGLTYLGDDTSTSNLTTYTFSTKAFGAARSDRTIIAVAGQAAAGASPIAFSSATIGGVAATLIKDYAPNQTNDYGTAIFGALVPTGTTGDIVVTWSAGAARCPIIWFSVFGLLSFTATDFYNNTTTSPSDTLTVSPGGIILAPIIYPAGTKPAVWTGLPYSVSRDSGEAGVGIEMGYGTFMGGGDIAVSAAIGSPTASSTSSNWVSLR